MGGIRYYPEDLLWRSKVDGSQRQRLSNPPFQAIHPRWSPDGKQIVFWGRSSEGEQTGSKGASGKLYKIHAVSPDGGIPDTNPR